MFQLIPGGIDPATTKSKTFALPPKATHLTLSVDVF